MDNHAPAFFLQPVLNCTVIAQPQIPSLLSIDLQKHPTAAEAALQLIVADYNSALPRARSGSALAVKACASHFDGDMLMTALHFLLEHGLADMAHVQDQKATVSEQMMQAGKSTRLCSLLKRVPHVSLSADRHPLLTCCTTRMQHAAQVLTTLLSSWLVANATVHLGSCIIAALTGLCNQHNSMQCPLALISASSCRPARQACCLISSYRTAQTVCFVIQRTMLICAFIPSPFSAKSVNILQVLLW